MNPDFFSHSLDGLRARRTGLVNRPNAIDPAWFNGIFERYVNPVITADHVLLSWRYDLDERSNPYLLESLGVNAASCAPAGVDRKGTLDLKCEFRICDDTGQRRKFLGGGAGLYFSPPCRNACECGAL